MKFRLNRDVTKEECHWLDRDFKKDEEVYEFYGCTYGCIGNTGTACSLKEGYKEEFFELPENALEIIK